MLNMDGEEEEDKEEEKEKNDGGATIDAAIYGVLLDRIIRKMEAKVFLFFFFILVGERVYFLSFFLEVSACQSGRMR